MSNKTILIVDDNVSNIDILVDLLGDYDLLVATDGESAIEIVNEEDVDIVLLDIVMPELDGFEVCRKLKNKTETQNIPIIFITSKADEDSIELAYEIGGIDYITKPFKKKEVLARVGTHLKIQSLIEHLEHLSSHDALTGIYNRRKFFESGLLKFQQQKENLYAVMIDIDNFKSVNDTYGHSTGDKVIKMLADLISAQLVNDSVLGRLGGEEFAILCNSAERQVVEARIELLRVAVEEMTIIADDLRPVKITISSGVSAMNESCSSLDILLKNADDALFEAKGSGRNRAVFRRI